MRMVKVRLRRMPQGGGYGISLSDHVLFCTNVTGNDTCFVTVTYKGKSMEVWKHRGMKYYTNEDRTVFVTFVKRDFWSADVEFVPGV